MDKQALADAIAPEWRPWLVAVLLAVVVAALAEGVVRSLWGRRDYDWRAFATTLGDSLGRRAFDALGVSLVAPLLLWAWGHRIATVPLSTAGAFALLFIGQEFCYYVYHRASHRVRWFWVTHSVHHSPNQLTLAAALRLGWTGKLTGSALFFLPLVWLGFPPSAVLATVALNLLYQFWLHATWIPKLGPLEWVLNTPSHHRVHHASNPEYVDCNYGGVLIVFDRLFGSFVAERPDVAIRYGLSTPLTTYNPLRIAFHEWLRLARDLSAARTPRTVLRLLFGPPGNQAITTAERSTRAAVVETSTVFVHTPVNPSASPLKEST